MTLFCSFLVCDKSLRSSLESYPITFISLDFYQFPNFTWEMCGRKNKTKIIFFFWFSVFLFSDFCSFILFHFIYQISKFEASHFFRFWIKKICKTSSLNTILECNQNIHEKVMIKVVAENVSNLNPIFCCLCQIFIGNMIYIYSFLMNCWEICAPAWMSWFKFI